ncbi:MAG: hypothetical protein GY803_10050, partial [Chloroflexi bacterium]|nr:hypothetical protein [Chloroflexota bacterium]
MCSLGQRLVEGFNNFYTDINDLVLDPIRDSIEVLQNSELGQQASQKLDDLRQWATANPKLAAGIALAAAGAIVVGAAAAVVLTGGAALLPAAILLGAAGGGVSGVVGQAVQDLASGQVSGWETYALQF